MDDWERKPDTNKTYVNLCPFIQAVYQRRLASGVITAPQSRYTSNNCFVGLTVADNVSDNGMADTIVESIQTHMANLSATVLLQLTMSNNANTAILNASMQKVAANEAQRNANHMHMLQQFAMMMTNWPGIQQFAGQITGQPAARPQAMTQCNFVPQAISVLPPAQQQGQPRGGGGCGGSRSRNGCGHLNPRNPVQPGAPVPFVGGSQMIPNIPAGIQHPQQQNPCCSNVVKQWANQNVCFSCGFDVKDWHNSATCPHKRFGHQNGCTHSNYSSTNMQIISFAGRQCTRQCTRKCDS
jgi:hypothetical protein